MLFLLRFAALDPRRGFASKFGCIIQRDVFQISFEKSPQIIRTRMQTQLNATHIDSDLHFGRTAEAKADIGAASGLFSGHLVGLLYGNRRLFNQDRADISEIDQGGCCTFENCQIANVGRKINPFGPRYSDQCAAAGLDLECSKRSKGDLFVNLFNHTRY
jgi:hypothetical protein